MKRHVDAARRALVEVSVGAAPDTVTETIEAWIDTGLNGFFAFPQSMIDGMSLQEDAMAEAILADGQKVTLKAYTCFVAYFDGVVAAQVIANDGRLPLLGTEFLADRELVVNYKTLAVTIQ